MKKKDKAKNNNKKFIITEFILGIIVIVCLIALCVAINNKKNSQIDFGQNITSADGGDFKPNYDAGHESNFSFRLADMECNDDCSNVSKVKIGDKELKLGEDYEVKRGSIIIIIYKKVMQALQTGKADITVSIEKDGKTVTVGVHITISNTATPSGTQPAQENQPEMTTNNHSSENNNPTPTQGSNTTPQTPTEPTPTPSEPTSSPTPTPTHTAEFNLNDGYKVNIMRIRWLKSEREDFEDCFVDNRMVCPERVFTTCTVKKGDVELKKSYNHGATETQFLAEQQQYTDMGYRIYEGMGFEPDLNEGYCSECNLSCDRW